MKSDQTWDADGYLLMLKSVNSPDGWVIAAYDTREQALRDKRNNHGSYIVGFRWAPGCAPVSSTYPPPAADDVPRGTQGKTITELVNASALHSTLPERCARCGHPRQAVEASCPNPACRHIHAV